MILVFIACIRPDPTHHLGPHDILWAPADLDADAVHHRRWLDRWAIVGTRPDPDIGAVIAGYADLAEDQAIEALTSALHGRQAHEAAQQLTRGFGEDGCRAVFEAWNDGTGANRHDFELALLGPNHRVDCRQVVDLGASARGRAALSAGSTP